MLARERYLAVCYPQSPQDGEQHTLRSTHCAAIPGSCWITPCLRFPSFGRQSSCILMMLLGKNLDNGTSPCCSWTNVFFKQTVLPMGGLPEAPYNTSGRASFTWTCSICSTPAWAVPRGIWSPQQPLLHLEVSVYMNFCATGNVCLQALCAAPMDISV